MPTTDEIKQRIETAIPDSNAEVEDWTGGGDHFRATVVSPAFAGLSRIQQHRLVMDVFAGEIGGAIHPLKAETHTPQEVPRPGTPSTPPPAPSPSPTATTGGSPSSTHRPPPPRARAPPP